MSNEQKPSKKELRAQKRAERKNAQTSKRRGKIFLRYGLIAFVSAAIAGGAYWLWNKPESNPEAFDVTRACTTDARTVFHVHPNLEISIEGVKQETPPNIGIVSPVCMRPLHTHDASGIIHVESPVNRDYTLGEFFRVWGKPFDREHIFDRVADAEHRVTMKVDGQASEEYGELVLKDKQRISISYEKIQ